MKSGEARSAVLFHEERGSALLIVILLLLLLAVMGLVTISQTSTEMQNTGRNIRGNQAFVHAEAGYVEALLRVSDPTDSVSFNIYDWQTSPGWGRYIVVNTGDSMADPEFAETLTDGFDNDRDGVVDEGGEHYPEFTTLNTASQVDYPWIKITYKLDAAGTPLLYGDHDATLSTPPRANTTDGLPILEITAQGRKGEENRIVRLDAARDPFPFPRAALYIESDTLKFDGNSFLVSGMDWDPVTETVIPGNPEVPGVATTGDPVEITDDLTVVEEDNIEGQGLVPSVVAADRDIDLQGIATKYSARADTTLVPGTFSFETWGDLNNMMVVYCPGDIKVTGGINGGGILIVDGDFEASGQFTWYGVVVVLGDIDLTGGGNSVHIWGTLMVQTDGETQNIGGNAVVAYSKEALDQLGDLGRYRILNWREL